MTAVVHTHIDRVVVFRNGALVTRTGVLPRPDAWPASVEIPGLPLLYAGETLRVAVRAPGVRVGALDEAPTLGIAPSSAADRRVERDRIAVALARVEQDRGALRELDRRYAALAPPEDPGLAPESPASLPDLAAMTALSDLGADAREAVAARLDALREEGRALRRAQRAFEREEASNSENGGAPAISRAVRTALSADAPDGLPAQLEVEVSYFSPAARWTPRYAVDVRSEGTATLSLSAFVAQATGEDWSGAAVHLATADLHRDTALPALASWRVGRRAPPPPPAWRPLPDDTDVLFRDYDQAGPAPRAPAPPPDAEAAPTETFAVQAMMDEADDQPAPPPAKRRVAELEASNAMMRSLGAAGAMPPPAPMAPPAAAPLSKSAAAPRRSRAPAFGRGAPPEGGSGIAPEPEEPAGPSGPGEGLLRYAWLRLAHPSDRRARGRLLQVNLLSDLRALAEQRGQRALAEPLAAALREQQKATQRLQRSPLPPGCAPLSGSGHHHRFPAGPRTDVPSDGRFHLLHVASGAAPARTVFRVVPRQSTQVYRYADLDNPLGAPLPQGPLEVSLDGERRATSQLQSLGVGSPLQLNLGVEERVRVARNTHFAESEKGVLTTTASLEHRVTTELRSGLPTAALIEVYERLPDAEDQPDATVTLDEASPAPTRDVGPRGERVPGALRFSLRLEPGQSGRIAYRYTVRIPAKMEIVGGNRREP